MTPLDHCPAASGLFRLPADPDDVLDLRHLLVRRDFDLDVDGLSHIEAARRLAVVGGVLAVRQRSVSGALSSHGERGNRARSQEDADACRQSDGPSALAPVRRPREPCLR